MTAPVLTWLCLATLAAYVVDAQPISGANFVVVLDACNSFIQLKVIGVQIVPTITFPPMPEITYNEAFYGLKSARENPEELRPFLQKVINVAKEHVPADQYKYTPLYLIGTSGMRLLPADEVENLLISCRQLLSDQSLNPFLYYPDQVKVITGQEQAAYLLASVNELLPYNSSREGLEHSGVLSLSPLDVQIALEVNELRLLGGKASISYWNRPLPYAHTYLAYGTMDLGMRVAKVLAESQLPIIIEGAPVALENPCLLKGHEKPGMRGTGQPEKCRDIMKKILAPNQGLQCAPKPCAIGSVYQPNVSNIKEGRFIATGELNRLLEKLGVNNEDKMLRIDQLDAAAVKYCRQQYPDIVGVLPPIVYTPSDPCMQGLYVSTLLTDSFGFEIDSKQIRLSNALLQEPNWALGFFLTSISPGEGPEFFE